MNVTEETLKKLLRRSCTAIPAGYEMVLGILDKHYREKAAQRTNLREDYGTIDIIDCEYTRYTWSSTWDCATSVWGTPVNTGITSTPPEGWTINPITGVATCITADLTPPSLPVGSLVCYTEWTVTYSCETESWGTPTNGAYYFGGTETDWSVTEYTGTRVTVSTSSPGLPGPEQTPICVGPCALCPDVPAVVTFEYPEHLYVGPEDLTYTDGWRTLTGERSLTFVSDPVEREEILNSLEGYAFITDLCIWQYSNADERVYLIHREGIAFESYGNWDLWLGVLDNVGNWSTLLRNGNYGFGTPTDPTHYFGNQSPDNTAQLIAIQGKSGTTLGALSLMGARIEANPVTSDYFIQTVTAQGLGLCSDVLAGSDYCASLFSNPNNSTVDYWNTYRCSEWPGCPIAESVQDWVLEPTTTACYSEPPWKTQAYRVINGQRRQVYYNELPAELRKYKPVWIATYNCDVGAWDIELNPTSRPCWGTEFNTVRGWEVYPYLSPVNNGVMTCITNDLTLPEPPTAVPTCYYTWEVYYDCFTAEWTGLSIVFTDTVGPASAWEDLGGVFMCVTTSNTPPALPTPPPCYYYWDSTYDCDLGAWSEPVLSYVDSFGSVTPWSVYDIYANCVTDTPDTPAVPEDIPVC